MDLGPHTAFIVAAYAAVLIVMGALTLWITLDYRVQKRTLEELESRSPRRR
jgi:heme exporter protein CcmD